MLKRNNFWMIRNTMFFTITIVLLSQLTPFYLGLSNNVQSYYIWSINSEKNFINGSFENLTIFENEEIVELKLKSFKINKWYESTSNNKPSDRIYHSISTIYNTDNILLHGGWMKSDTWIYNYGNDNWTKLSPILSPGMRYHHEMGTIYTDHSVLLFGGIGSNQNINHDDTWIFKGNKWFKKEPKIKPIGRSRHAMAGIYNTDKILMFGGGSDIYLEDTWIYDHSENNWVEMNLSVKPNARHSHAMSTIFGTDKVLLFGGYGIGDKYYDDTWVYDLSDNEWRQIELQMKPIIRTGHTMAPIFGTSKVVLFGGGYYNKEGEVGYWKYYNDTWIFDIEKKIWSNELYLNSPRGRTFHSMASICGTDRQIIFSGSTDTNDTWIHNPYSYFKNGVYISEIFKNNSKLSFKSINWNSNVPLETNFKIQLRSGKDSTNLYSKDFVGFNGDINTFYTTSPSNIWSGHNNDSYIQFKIIFQTNNDDKTPLLYNVTISYEINEEKKIEKENKNQIITFEIIILLIILLIMLIIIILYSKRKKKIKRIRAEDDEQGEGCESPQARKGGG